MSFTDVGSRPYRDAAPSIRRRVCSSLSLRVAKGFAAESAEKCGPVNILGSSSLRYTSKRSKTRRRPCALGRHDPLDASGAGSENSRKSMPVDIAQLLAFAVKNNASDLH
ncbi:MAG TPA: hypothetical protein VF161_12700, partial [Steroidobacteraceae bacterium]